jgi:predicted transcriptional regulator
MSIKEMRYRYSYGKDAEKAAQIAHIKELRYTRQMSVNAIAQKLGMSASTVDSYLKPDLEERVRQTRDLADALIKSANSNKAIHAIDVGKGVSNGMGVKSTKLEAALTVLKDEGYLLVKAKIPNPANIKKGTEMMFLYSPTESMKKMSTAEATKAAYKDIMQNLDKINPPYDVYVDENGKTTQGIEPPVSIDSKRIQVMYADPRDGMIAVRRGAKDLSLGDATYAQVRIGVDGTHYIKGVAVTLDDDKFPKGKDVIVYSNRKEGTPLTSPDDNVKQVLKPMKKNPDGSVDMEDPFGAQIMAGGQKHYVDSKGVERLGSINKVNEEGKWGDWTSARTLASQVLSKQDPKLAQQQLNLQKARFDEQFEEIKKITNPVVREKELIDFAEECDKAAVHLKAASLPGQSVKVLLPSLSLKQGEVYAPSYKDGDKLALIRYPHTGKHEMPILTVNNKNREGRAILGTNPSDAICINPKDAQILSGADFDGDTVVVIPNNKHVVRNAPQLESLKDFDTKAAYPGYEGMPVIKHQTQQTEMGKITNLITDMNLIGAPPDEMARAVKYSMVIIDSEKHKLNYKACYDEMRISELKAKYRPKEDSDKKAGTIVSLASGEAHVPERTWQGKIDPETGEKIYRYTERRKTVDPVTGRWKYYNPSHPNYDPKGELATIESTNMAEAKDAMELVSKAKYPMELVYAKYANQMKAMANKARKESLKAEAVPYNPSAAKAYAKEIESLAEKVEISKINAVLERRAVRATTMIVDERRKNYPERYNQKTPDGKAHLKKMRSQVLNQQRAILNKAKAFDITDREWEAIQSGALRKTKVKEIIDRANQESVKSHALPKDTSYTTMTPANISHAKAMLNAGYTQAEVAEMYGISTTTLRKNIK